MSQKVEDFFAARTPSPQKVMENGLKLLTQLSIQRARPDGSHFLWAHALKAPLDVKTFTQETRDDFAAIAKTKTPDHIDAICVLTRAIIKLDDQHSMFTVGGRHITPWSEYKNINHQDLHSAYDYYLKLAVGIITPKATPDQPHNSSRGDPTPTMQNLGDGIYRIEVPGPTVYTGYPIGQAYEEKLHQFFQSLQRQAEPVRGFIVDASNNGGGSILPTTRGLSHLLGTGKIGGFSGPEGIGYVSIPEDYNLPMYGKKLTPNFFGYSNAPVAFIMGNGTNSAGESLATFFMGRPNTQTFGSPTHGASTGNKTFSLIKGKGKKELVQINICSGFDIDRKGRGSGAPLKPDVDFSQKTSDPKELEEMANAAARKWLLTKPLKTYAPG